MRARLFTVLGILSVLLLLTCVFPLPVEFVLTLAFGWALFLVRVLPEVEINWPDVGLGLAALALFAGGVHWASDFSYLRRRSTVQDAGFATSRSPWKIKCSLAAVAMVVLMFASGTAVIGIVHQASWLITMDEPMFSWGIQEVVRRNGSQNNLMHIGVATINHESARRSFPAGCTTDASGRLLHGWMAQILPFAEEQGLYGQIDFHEPWDSKTNRPAFREPISFFMSPMVYGAEDKRGFSLTHYTANAFAMAGDRARNQDDFSDGLSHTVLIGEAAGNYKAWGSPTNWRDPGLGLGGSPNGFGGPWSGDITIVTFADGHSRALSNDIDPELFRALCTPAGGEPFRENDLD